MSLRSRFALAFALVSAVVAGLVGVLSYGAASDRVTAEIDRSLRQVTTALANGQEEVLAPSSCSGPAPDETRVAAAGATTTSSRSRSRWPPTAPSPRSAVDP